MVFFTNYLSLCRWHTITNIFWVVVSQRKVFSDWFIYPLFISWCNIPRMQWLECQISGKINDFVILVAIKKRFMFLGRNYKHIWSQMTTKTIIQLGVGYVWVCVFMFFDLEFCCSCHMEKACHFQMFLDTLNKTGKIY